MPKKLSPYFFLLEIHPQALEEKKTHALYILVGGRHLVFQTEGGNKAVIFFASGLFQQGDRKQQGFAEGVQTPAHCCGTWMNIKTCTVHMNFS